MLMTKCEKKDCNAYSSEPSIYPCLHCYRNAFFAKDYYIPKKDEPNQDCVKC